MSARLVPMADLSAAYLLDEYAYAESRAPESAAYEERAAMFRAELLRRLAGDTPE